MRRVQTVLSLAAGVVLSASGCGLAGTPAPASEAASKPAIVPTTTPVTESQPASPTPASGVLATGTGSLSTAPLKCTDFEPPAGLTSTGARPGACAFESATDYVSFVVGSGPRTFDMAKRFELGRSNEKVIIAQVPATGGWTFAARWPSDEGPLLRVQRWLVDAKGQVLLCKMGTERGEKAVAQLATVCEHAKDALFAASRP